MRVRLERAVFGPGDDLVLEGSGQIAEVVTVAGDPHDQIAMLFGMRLGVAQSLGRDDIELQVVPSEGSTLASECHSVNERERHT